MPHALRARAHAAERPGSGGAAAGAAFSLWVDALPRPRRFEIMEPIPSFADRTVSAIARAFGIAAVLGARGEEEREQAELRGRLIQVSAAKALSWCPAGAR